MANLNALTTGLYHLGLTLINNDLRPMILGNEMRLNLLILRIRLSTFTLGRDLIRLDLNNSIFGRESTRSCTTSGTRINLRLLNGAVTIRKDVTNEGASINTSNERLTHLHGLSIRIILDRLVLSNLRLQAIFRDHDVSSIRYQGDRRDRLVNNVQGLSIGDFVTYGLGRFLRLSLVILRVTFDLRSIRFVLDPLDNRLYRIDLARLTCLRRLLTPFFILLTQRVTLLIRLSNLYEMRSLRMRLYGLFLRLSDLDDQVRLYDLNERLIRFCLVVILISVPGNMIAHRKMISIMVRLISTNS